MPDYLDQMQRMVTIPSAPKRIISCVPSQTELLFYLGLNNEVVGITKFCIHPKTWFRTKTRIGGTKNIDISKIRTLEPDLIIANKEENRKKDIELLEKEFPVWISDVNNLMSALDMITAIGVIIGKEYAANDLRDKITNEFQLLHKVQQKINACYMIWRDPYIAAGGNTFIDDMMYRAGYINTFKQQARYPAVQLTDLIDLKCELVFLSSEPYPFANKHIEEISDKVPGIPVMLVDGEMFSWYGSRLLQAPLYFNDLRIQALSVL